MCKGAGVHPGQQEPQVSEALRDRQELKTKINVNLGTSRDCMDMDVEMQKVMASVNMGVESIMDLSSYGDTQKFRRKLAQECPAILGHRADLRCCVYYNKALKLITSDEWIDIVRMHAEDGVDFMTIHCGINRQTAERFKQAKRIPISCPGEARSFLRGWS